MTSDQWAKQVAYIAGADLNFAKARVIHLSHSEAMHPAYTLHVPGRHIDGQYVYATEYYVALERQEVFDEVYILGVCEPLNTILIRRIYAGRSSETDLERTPETGR